MAFLERNSPLRRRWLGLAWTGLCFLTACDLTDAGKSGELDRGVFFYECDDNPDDAFCDRPAHDREFPAAVAVGAAFRVDYAAEDADAHVELVSGCVDCMERSPQGFRMLEEGRAPLLAENADREIYDVLHIDAKAASTLTMRVDGDTWPDGELLLLAGGRYDLTASPRAADGTELGGALGYQWSIDDATVVELLSSSERNDVELRALAAGETTVTVTSGDLSFALAVRVKEGQ